jgi:tetratricopeptide (TPR) repeat protein
MSDWRRLGAAVVAAAIMIALPAPALAEKRASGESAEREQKARTLYLAGEQSYANAEYEQAARQFQIAYRMSGRVQLLLRLADALERAGHYKKAADTLRSYMQIARTDSERARVRDLERREKEAASMEASGSLSFDGSSSEGDHRPSRTPAYTLLGAGAITAGAAVTFGLLSRSARSEAAEDCGPELCTQDARGALDRELRYAILADVSAGVAVISVGAGVYMWWRAHRAAKRASLAVGPSAGDGSIGVALGGSF